MGSSQSSHANAKTNKKKAPKKEQLHKSSESVGGRKSPRDIPVTPAVDLSEEVHLVSTSDEDSEEYVEYENDDAEMGQESDDGKWLQVGCHRLALSGISHLVSFFCRNRKRIG